MTSLISFFIVSLILLNTMGIVYLVFVKKIFEHLFQENVYKTAINTFKFFLLALLLFLAYELFELLESETLSDISLLISLLAVSYGLLKIGMQRKYMEETLR